MHFLRMHIKFLSDNNLRKNLKNILLEVYFCVRRYLTSVTVYLCNTNQLTYYLSSVYFANQLLHISGIFVAHHQEVNCIHYTEVSRCTVNRT